jgi:hypothetical protein
MLKKRYSLLLMCVLVAFSFAWMTGCAQPPTEEIAKADKAVADAKSKEANLYVEEGFKKAEDALKKAKDQVTAKQYKEAKQAAIDAASLAQQAIAGIEAGKAKMKEDAAGLAADIEKAVDALKTDVAAAIKKKLPVAKEEVQAAIGKWGVDLAVVKDKLKDGKIREAFDELKAMMAAVVAKKDMINSMGTPEAAAPVKK